MDEEDRRESAERALYRHATAVPDLVSAATPHGNGAEGVCPSSPNLTCARPSSGVGAAGS